MRRGCFSSFFWWDSNPTMEDQKWRGIQEHSLEPNFVGIGWAEQFILIKGFGWIEKCGIIYFD